MNGISPKLEIPHLSGEPKSPLNLPFPGSFFAPSRLRAFAVQIQLRGLESLYRAQWFDPRTAAWQDVSNGTLRSSVIGIIALPDFLSDADWGLRLTLSSARS